MNILSARVSLATLNTEFNNLTFEQRLNRLYHYFSEEEILFTSSFGINSAFLLHLISQIRPTQPIFFIDTTYHFEETIAYKNYLKNYWNLNLQTITPHPKDNKFSREQNLWQTDPNKCCTINKVEPLERIKGKYKIWVSGVMAYQTPFRAGLDIFEEQENGIIKFHPLIDMSEMLYLAYNTHYQLPIHPLSVMGYGSVGCTHCTQKGEGRDGRWKNSKKTECGLHL